MGRTAYTDTVKKILLSSESEEVLKRLVKDLNNLLRGTAKDESSWVDVTSYATKILNKKGDFVFMTPEQRSNLTNSEVEILKQNGKQLILIPDTVMNKVGDEITTFNNVMEIIKSLLNTPSWMFPTCLLMKKESSPRLLKSKKFFIAEGIK